jgi:hypothetical protein
LHSYNYSLIQCPPGSNISEILEIGLENSNQPNENSCPTYNLDTMDGIHLELDPECTWKWKRRDATNQMLKQDIEYDFYNQSIIDQRLYGIKSNGYNSDGGTYADEFYD